MFEMARILIADDEQKMRHLLSMILEGADHEVIPVEDGQQAYDQLEKNRFDMLITDIKMPRMTGIQLLERIKQEEIPCPVIIITAFATIDSAVDAMRTGASDYITKPFDTEQILLAVERTLNVSKLLDENKVLKDRIRTIEQKKKIIYESEKMRQLLELASNVAQSDSAVLIQGESGTGKELIARFVHEASPRASARFVPVNCAAISSSLVESELFGHEKGAFTGADKQVQGKFEFASKGTIFLDEIGDLPLETQAKLLRVLQEKRICRVGGNKEIETDVRVICATNKNLEELVKKEKFRDDLFYRINVFPLVPPPLRERQDDIIPLVRHFLDQYEIGRQKELSNGAQAILTGHSWPGNVRELANAVERGMILSGADGVLKTEVFSFLNPDNEKSLPEGDLFRLPPGGIDLEKVVSNLALQALEAASGNQSEAARRLGLTRAKFRVLIKQAGGSNES